MNKLLQFFKSEFPNDIADIRDGIELLCHCLDNAIHNINEKAGMAFSERKFEQMESLSGCVKQIDEMQIKLESYSALLDWDHNIDGNITNNHKNSKNEDRRVPNYSDFTVDGDLAYALNEDFTHRRPAGFSL